MKNKELIEKILKIMEEISEEDEHIPEKGRQAFQEFCKYVSLKLIEKLGKEDL